MTTFFLLQQCNLTQDLQWLCSLCSFNEKHASSQSLRKNARLSLHCFSNGFLSFRSHPLLAAPRNMFFLDLGRKTTALGTHGNLDFQSSATKNIYVRPRSHLQSPLGTQFISIGKTRWFVKIFRDVQNALKNVLFSRGSLLKTQS